MIFLTLLQFILVTLLVAFGVTQMVIPLIKGTPMFPMFRKSRIELESKISELQGELEEEELAKRASELSKKLKKSNK